MKQHFFCAKTMVVYNADILGRKLDENSDNCLDIIVGFEWKC